MRFLLGVFGLCAALAAAPADAGDWTGLTPFSAKSDWLAGRGDFTNGVDVSAHGWSAYGAAVFALTGPADRDGWRLKLWGSYGRYGYVSTGPNACRGNLAPGFAAIEDICNSVANAPPQGAELDQITAALSAFGLELHGDRVVSVTPHQVTRTTIGLAPGYQASLGAVILKAYLGAAFEQQDVAPEDPDKSLRGSYWGAQSWLEAWLPLGEDGWLAADGAYFTGTSSYSAAMKLGYRPLSWLSLGPELAAFGDADDMSGRAGAFLRFDAAGLETTLTAGLSGSYREDPAPFGAINIYKRF